MSIKDPNATYTPLPTGMNSHLNTQCASGNYHRQQINNDASITINPRLSRRDQFAMAAMQGILSNAKLLGPIAIAAEQREKDVDVVAAALSMAYADALIAELDKEKAE